MPRKITTKVRGVFEEQPGIWAIRYSDGKGKIRRERVPSRAAGVALYQQRKTEIRNGAKLPANLRYKGATVRSIAEYAVEWYKSHKKKDVRTFEGRMNLLIRDLGNRLADDITPQEIDRWIGKHTAWSPATANRYKTTLSKAYQLALVSGHVKSNPARLVVNRPENNRRTRYLTTDEEADLREAIIQRCPENLESFELALHTGMRKGEQFTLDWSQVDFDRKIIRLTRTKNGNERDVYLNKTSVAALGRLLKRHGSKRGRVFLSRLRNAPLRDPKKWFNNVLDEAQINDFTWHDLRHTFCSRLVMKGVHLKAVQELAGHKDISMTIRYSHLSPEHNQEAIQKLDDF